MAQTPQRVVSGLRPSLLTLEAEEGAARGRKEVIGGQSTQKMTVTQQVISAARPLGVGRSDLHMGSAGVRWDQLTLDRGGGQGGGRILTLLEPLEKLTAQEQGVNLDKDGIYPRLSHHQVPCIRPGLKSGVLVPLLPLEAPRRVD